MAAKNRTTEMKSGDWCVDVIITPESSDTKIQRVDRQKIDTEFTPPRRRPKSAYLNNFAFKISILHQFLEPIFSTRIIPTPRHQEKSHHRPGKPV